MDTKYLRSLLVILATALLFLTGCATTPATKVEMAEKKDTSWMYHDSVDVEFVQQYVAMPKPKNVMIIDSRPKKAKFDKGYIPTAVSIPDSKFNKMTDLLPEDKNTLLIFYCQGPT